MLASLPPPHTHTYAGCESNATVLPLNKNIRWPPTLKGDSADVRCPTNSANITVTRMCDKDRQWLRPVHLQDCYNATIDEAFSEILKMLNQVSLCNIVPVATDGFTNCSGIAHNMT